MVLDGCPRFAKAYLGRKRRAQPHQSFYFIDKQIRAGLGKAFETYRFRPRYPDFLHGAPPIPACAAFFKESRMKCANASKVDRKSGVRFGEPGAPVRILDSSGLTDVHPFHPYTGPVPVWFRWKTDLSPVPAEAVTNTSAPSLPGKDGADTRTATDETPVG